MSMNNQNPTSSFSTDTDSVDTSLRQLFHVQEIRPNDVIFLSTVNDFPPTHVIPQHPYTVMLNLQSRNLLNEENDSDRKNNRKDSKRTKRRKMETGAMKYNASALPIVNEIIRLGGQFLEIHGPTSIKVVPRSAAVSMVASGLMALNRQLKQQQQQQQRHDPEAKAMTTAAAPEAMADSHQRQEEESVKEFHVRLESLAKDLSTEEMAPPTAALNLSRSASQQSQQRKAVSTLKEAAPIAPNSLKTVLPTPKPDLTNKALHMRQHLHSQRPAQLRGAASTTATGVPSNIGRSAPDTTQQQAIPPANLRTQHLYQHQNTVTNQPQIVQTQQKQYQYYRRSEQPCHSTRRKNPAMRPLRASLSSTSEQHSAAAATALSNKVQLIEDAIPPDASCIFHIFDRRVNMDALEVDVSNYALLRTWVRDDPFVQRSSSDACVARANLQDFGVVASQVRDSKRTRANEKHASRTIVEQSAATAGIITPVSVSPTKMDHRVELKPAPPQSAETVDLFALLASSSNCKDDNDVQHLKDEMIQRAKKRKQREIVQSKQRDQQAVKSLKRKGIDIEKCTVNA